MSHAAAREALERKNVDATSTSPAPNPGRLFEMFTAYQQSAALRAAVELDLGTAIAERQTTAEQIAERAGASVRGIRILCDYLTIVGVLTKDGPNYGLTVDSAMFLNRRSPAYLGTVARFLDAPELLHFFDRLTEAVCQGGTAVGEGTLKTDNPLWVEFARSMAPLMVPPANFIAKLVDAEKGNKCRILDIAAGHGLFGITIARINPRARIVAQDWPSVLAVAKDNAQQAGITERYSTIPGNAFEVDFGENYDFVLLTNFLHHFDPATNEKLLRKVHAALAPNGCAVTLDFVPNNDRVTPPDTAAFSLMMLGSTPHGDAYTFAEFERMFTRAGFTRCQHFREPDLRESVIVSCK